jgi:prephenate dehydrogenase
MASLGVKKFKQLGLIGCGMMGGSFALALKEAGLVERVVGYSKSPNSTEKAKRLGIIDDAAASILQGVMGADLVLIAVPVAATAEIFKSLKFGLDKDALVLDVGSTKQSVIHAAEKSFGKLPPNFVPSHPIAGKERAGIDEAEADLYKNKRVILTPTLHTSSEAVARAVAVWRTLGMTVSQMTAEEHDRIFAAVSHFPHVLAFAYMNGLRAQEDAKMFLQMAGPGFRDFTRIAASNADIWTDICMANASEILKQSKAMRASLALMEQAMQKEMPQQLKDLIETASLDRSGWSMNKTMTADDV